MGIATNGGGEEPLSARIGDASAVLLLAPRGSDHEDEACSDLLTVTDPAYEDVLTITLTQSCDRRLDVWNAHVGSSPAKTGVVCVDETVRSTAAKEGGSSPTLGNDTFSVRTVASAGDLTRLGIAITDTLSEWDDDGNQVVACFHSLTPLLQYVDVRRLFRFLHVLVGRLAQGGAVAHFHMDPTAHEEETLRTLEPLFDAVVERGEDGEWVVR